jgi:hypothetical protein
MSGGEPVIIYGDTPISAFTTITPHYYINGPSYYNTKFNVNPEEKLPKIITQILTKHKNVALAGGSLVSILSRIPVCGTQDYDLFILGGENWDTVHDIVKMVKGKTTRIGRGVVNILGSSLCEHPIQLIMSNNANVKELLGSFDIGLCMIAYCGGVLYMDELAHFGIKHQVVPITKNISTARINKYINRGFGIATTYDYPITHINNLEIDYKTNGKYMGVIESRLTKCDIIKLEMCQYAHCNSYTFLSESDPVIKPFIFYISTTDYIPGIDYENLTLREYIDIFGIEYETEQEMVNVDEVYAKIFELNLTFAKYKITRRYVENIIDAFYENLDKKINFWLDSFNN